MCPLFMLSEERFYPRVGSVVFFIKSGKYTYKTNFSSVHLLSTLPYYYFFKKVPYVYVP